MVEFSGKILILGCGSVAQCTIPILLKLVNIDPHRITVMDFVDNRARIKNALGQGLKYVQMRITPENLHTVLKQYVGQGDLLIDLSWNVETVAIVDWCHHHGVLYLNTSVELWEPYKDAHRKHPTELTLYHRQMALRKMAAAWKNGKGPTAVVDHGANPGLVSHFTKQALVEIATRIVEETNPGSRQVRIEQALASENFAQLAHLTGVKTIHISERDSQITNDPKKRNEFVNTWSVEGFIEEGIAPAELGWGTHEKNVPRGAMFHAKGPRNQICLSQRGMKTWVRSWVPSGEITGMVIRHGEAFSLSDELTVWEGNSPVYRPTVHYAYCPCDSAINSMHELEMRHLSPQPSQRILNDEIIGGEDELGCLLMGHDFQSWWIGSVLSIEEARRLVPEQNATTVQVAIGIVAAAVYQMRHPQLGFCLPDHLHYKEILEIAKPYLGKFVSMPVNWSPLDNIEKVIDYNKPLPRAEDKWQFTTFLVTPIEVEEKPVIANFAL